MNKYSTGWEWVSNQPWYLEVPLTAENTFGIKLDPPIPESPWYTGRVNIRRTIYDAPVPPKIVAEFDGCARGVCEINQPEHDEDDEPYNTLLDWMFLDSVGPDGNTLVHDFVVEAYLSEDKTTATIVVESYARDWERGEE